MIPVGASALVLVPAARKAVEISQRLDRLQAGRTEAPTGEGAVRVATLAEYAHEIADAATGGPTIPAAVVPALTAEALRDGGGLADVRRFPGVARRLADLVATLKRYGYSTPNALADGLTRLRGRARPPARDRLLVEAFELYERALAGRSDPADRALAAATALERGDGTRPGRVLITGFHDLDHVQRRVIQALAVTADRLDMLCDEEPWEGATTATAGLVDWADSWMRRASPARPTEDPPPRAARRRVAEALFSARGSAETAPTLPPDVQGAVELIEADDALAEVTDLARSLSERQAWSGGRRVAAVFPDLARYAPLVREVFPRFEVPFDLAHGSPLLDTPVGRSAMAALEFVADGLPRRGLYDMATAPFLRVRAKAGDLWPGWLDGHAREAGVVGGGGQPNKEWIELLEARAALLAASSDRAPDAEMLRRQITVLRSMFRQLAPLRRRAAPAALAGAVSEALDGLGLFGRAGRPAPGVPEELVREERAALRALETSLVEAPLALGTTQTIGIRRLVAALRSDWASRPVRLPGDPGGVRILGRLEPRSLEFDELRLGGLSADRFPGATASGGGVLSERDRAGLGLPLQDRRADEARHLVYRALLAPTDRLSLSWPTREGASPLLPADIVADLRDLLGGSPRQAPSQAVGPRARQLIDLGRGALVDGDQAAMRGMAADAARRGEGPWTRWEGRLGQDRTLTAELSDRLGPDQHIFSPSQLEAALRCPFAWFTDRILRLDRMEDEEEDDTLPALWGDLVHRILARWTLDSDTSVDPTVRMGRALRTTLAESPWREQSGPFWEAQRDALEKGLLARFLTAEADSGRSATHAELRFGAVAAEARDLEDPRSTDSPLVLGSGDRAVTVAGRIDRVDAGDGWVFDYKTGNPPPVAAMGPAATLQLPLYLLALRRTLKLPIGRATWYRLRPDRVGPVARAWPPKGVEVDGALAEVEHEIVERVAALRAGELTMVPAGTTSCPARCAYRRMCRVEDTRIRAARAAQAAEQ